MNERCSRPTLLLFKPTLTGGELHLLGAPLSFFPALASVFLPCADVVAAAFWALSLGVVCAAAEAEADSAEVLEDLEACAGFEVVLEGCLRRLPSSPAEDEVRLLLLPLSPIGGCRESSQENKA